MTLMSLIGSGGSGTVFKGRWKNMDVAVKVWMGGEREGDSWLVW